MVPAEYFSEMEGMDMIRDWKSKGEVIVFTNGCFDLLHPGHIQYLEEAKSLGSKLVIGINTDDSVTHLKGKGRPIMNLEDRMLMLIALKPVDLVLPFSEETPARLIKEISPNILVKGGDYTLDTIVGAEYVESIGGEVKVLSFKDGYATSTIINKILQLKNHD